MKGQLCDQKRTRRARVSYFCLGSNFDRRDLRRAALFLWMMCFFAARSRALKTDLIDSREGAALNESVVDFTRERTGLLTAVRRFS